MVQYGTFFIENGQLKSMRESETNTVFDIHPLSENRFMFSEGDIEYQFSLNADGQEQVSFIADTEVKGHKIDKAMPAPRKELLLANEILAPYEGKYELAPDFYVDITVSGNQIFAQATGQGQFELFAENNTTFYAKITALKIIFNKNSSGDIVSFTLYQGGQETRALKIE
jgi:hypothetical protein